MINKILESIDNEESYYVGTNGCLYQDLDKKELLAIKQEIENLHSIIKEVREYIKDNAMYSEEEKICCDDLYTSDCDEVLKILDKAGSESNDS